MKPFCRALVLGGSSGIGAELARQLARAGTDVMIVGRDESRLQEVRRASPDHIKAHVLNLTDILEKPDDLLTPLVDEIGGLDLFIWSAGVMPKISPAPFDPEKDIVTIKTNFLAAAAWLDLAAARFEKEGTGTIVGIGSVAGDRGRQAQPAYNASKAALHSYLESLRNRLDRSGVTVVTIKPGPVATPMVEDTEFEKRAMPVELAARRILAKCGSPGEHYLAFSHRIIFAAVRMTPGSLFRRLKL